MVTLADDGSNAELTFHSDLPSEDATVVNINTDGELVKATSSARYKTNIQPLTTDTSTVLDLEPKAFEYEDSGQESTGLIAEEVDNVLPYLVNYDGEGRPESVLSDRVGVYLVPEVDENRDRLDDLEETTADQDATVEELEADLDAKDERIEELETENAGLRAENEALRQRVAAIEAELGLDGPDSTAVADD